MAFFDDAPADFFVVDTFIFALIFDQLLLFSATSTMTMTPVVV